MHWCTSIFVTIGTGYNGYTGSLGVYTLSTLGMHFDSRYTFMCFRYNGVLCTLVSALLYT